MNEAARAVLVIFGVLFAIVVVILAIPYLSPYSGSASSGLSSTGDEFTNILPWIGIILAGGMTLAALEGRRRG